MSTPLRDYAQNRNLPRVILRCGAGKDYSPARRPAAAAVPKASAAAPAAAPVIEDGIPDEVVAAIAAAIASMDGGRYTLRSLTRKKEGRGAWSLAGVVSTTEPF